MTTVRSGAAAGVQAHRVIFIDLARALAVLFMLYGHTVSALLAPEYQQGTWFAIWTFQRGLTSSLFLLLSGFAFSIATSRHWPLHVQLSPQLVRRTRRFGLFILLGYALHFPASRFADLAGVSPARWQSFLAVDVLQLIGVSFLAIQFLVLAVRTRGRFMAACFALAVVVVAATPWAWQTDWSSQLPPWAAAYLSPAGGSQFPIFPWSGFVLAGAALGKLYARWGASHLTAYALNVLLWSGVALIAGVFAARAVPWSVFGAGAAAAVPPDVAGRIGSCLILLAALAAASRRIHRLPHLFGAVAQETLLIYFVHLCIVYGSVWNPGLAQAYGATLGPVRVLALVVLLVAAMVALAWGWNRFKHTRPRAARWTAWVAGGLLIYRLV